MEMQRRHTLEYQNRIEYFSDLLGALCAIPVAIAIGSTADRYTCSFAIPQINMYCALYQEQRLACCLPD